MAVQNIRRFEKRARSYLQTYLYISQQKFGLRDKEQTVEDRYAIKDGVDKIGFDIIEKLSKMMKIHRCYLDTDTGYINYIIDLTNKIN